MKKKHCGAFVGICLLIAAFSVFYACKEETIKIGFAGQLTGINSDLGVHARNGAILAIDSINKLGGINGKKIQLISKDDENNPQKAAEVDKELINLGVVAIIGHATSSQTMAVLPMMNKEKTVLLSPTTSTPKLSNIKDMFFRVQGSSALSAKGIGQFFSKSEEISGLIVIRSNDNDDYTIPYKNYFLKGLKRFNQEYTEIIIDPQNPSHGIEAVNALKLEDNHAVLIIAAARITASIVQTLKNKNPNLFILISSWGSTMSLIRHGGTGVEGVYLSKTGYLDKENTDYIKFLKIYQHRYGKTPSFAAEQGYHSVKILEKALIKTKGKKQGLPEALTQLKSFGSFHGELYINEYGDAIMPVSILKIEKGKFKKITDLTISEQ